MTPTESKDLATRLYESALTTEEIRRLHASLVHLNGATRALGFGDGPATDMETHFGNALMARRVNAKEVA